MTSLITGYFANIKKISTYNDVVSLRSPELNTSGCLEFWYQLDGRDAELNVALEDKMSHSEGRTLVWSLRDADQTEWRKALVPITNMKLRMYQVLSLKPSC